MKDFDITKAKVGDPVITKSGKEAEILFFERKIAKFHLVVIIENKYVYYYTDEGKFYSDKNSDRDLMMK